MKHAIGGERDHPGRVGPGQGDGVCPAGRVVAAVNLPR